MNVRERNKMVYALSHTAPSSLNAPGDFFLNELDAHAAKSRHRKALEIYTFDAPQDDINRAIVSGNLYDSVVHLEVTERLMLLKTTSQDSPESVMNQLKREFENELEEQPAVFHILQDTSLGALPVKQAARAIINYTGALTRQLISEHNKARAEIEAHHAHYQPDAILARSLDIRSTDLTIKANSQSPVEPESFAKMRADYYQSLIEPTTDCDYKMMTSAFIDEKEYSLTIEFDYQNNSDSRDNVNGIEVGHMTLTGPIQYAQDDILEVIEDPDMVTYQVAGQDAKELLKVMNQSEDNAFLIPDLVKYARAMRRPEPDINVDLDLDREMKLGRL